MDSCVLDVAEAKPVIGDKAYIFSNQLTVFSISKKLKTIPYEILSVLNRRIKRIYSNE